MAMQQAVNLSDLGSSPGGGAISSYGNSFNQRVPGSSPGWGATPRWCNGSTGDFESLSLGSSPGFGTKYS